MTDRSISRALAVLAAALPTAFLQVQARQTWTFEEIQYSKGPTERQGHAMVEIDGDAYVIGGCNSVTLECEEELDIRVLLRINRTARKYVLETYTLTVYKNH
jgi:hypothetical protein